MSWPLKSQAADDVLRVLVFSQHFWPESFRINDFTRDLREAGCDVSVLTGQPNYPEGRVFEGYFAWGTGQQNWDGIPVFRVPLAPRGQSSAARLALNYLSFILSSSLIGPRRLAGRPVDAVFVYGTSPILQALGALAVGRIKRAAVVIWVQDLWPESLEVTGYVKWAPALALVRRIVSFIYRKADLLLVQSEAFCAEVAPMAGATPVVYFPNPGERLAEADEEQPALTLPPGFNVVFTGNLGTVQALPTILDAAEQLRDIEDLRFVLIGSGSRADWLASEVSRRELLNVLLPGRFAPESMPGIFAQASALLLTLSKSAILAKTVPSKLQSYLAAGRPVIAAIDGEGARIVETSEAGLAVPAEDADALARQVRNLYCASPARRAEMGEAGRRYYATHFDPQVLARRLRELLWRVVRR